LPLVRKVYLIASDNQRTQAASRPVGVDVLPSDGISAPRTHRANYAACGFCGQQLLPTVPRCCHRILTGTRADRTG